MFRSRPTKRRQPADAAAPRNGRSRRLAIEAMESRLMLSGNEIDYSIWNLDSIQNNYAVISQGGTLPAEATPSASDSNSVALGGQIDVGWVQVPGMYLNPEQAAQLAHQHWKDAYAHGLVTSQNVVDLYVQLRDRYVAGLDATSVPVFAIGYGVQNSGLDSSGLNGGLGNYDLDSPGIDVLAPPIGYPILAHFANSSTFVSTNVWPNSLDLAVTSGVGASSWKLVLVDRPFSDSIEYARFNPARARLNSALFRDGLDVLTNFQSTLDVELNEVLEKPIVEVSLVDDAAVVGSPASVTPSVIETVVFPPVVHGLFSPSGDAIVVQPEGPASIIDLGAQIVGQVVGHSATPAANDLDATVDQLLAEDTILAENSGEAAVENAAGGGGAQLVDAGGESSPGIESEGDSAAAPEANLLAEGGMVPVESIVGAVASGDLEIAPTGEQLAGAGDGAELIGDLARVAVMELIEGAEEPMAPMFDGNAIEGDHVAVLAAHDAAGSVQLAKVARGETASDGSIVRTFAEQAGAAVALVMPVSPSYLAALVTSVSDVIAAVAFGETAESASEASLAVVETSDVTRDEAFADWEDTSADSLTSKEDGGFSYLSTLPLVGALAIERLMAAKRRRQQAADERNPKRRPSLLG